MNTLKKLRSWFGGRPKKYALLDLPNWVNDESSSVLSGVLKGGVIKAEVVEETDKAINLRYVRTYLPLGFGLPIRTQEFCGWMLKTDERIVEIYES